MSGRVVPASAHGHLQALLPCEVEGGRHIASAEATRDHGRPAVDEGVEAAARRVVSGIRGADDGAGQRPPQLGQALVQARGRGHCLLRRLVDEDGDAVTDHLRVGEAQALHLAGLAEQALALPEDHREDHQAKLVDEVVLDQRLHELRRCRGPRCPHPGSA